jgi:hypothetical protein
MSKLLLKVSQVYVPGYVKKKRLEELLACTAVAFQTAAPTLNGLPFDRSLARYALFTAEQAENALRHRQSLKALRHRLYGQAYRLGQNLRREFDIHSTGEVMAMAGVLYRVLGIEFQGTVDGDVTIRRCFFSQFYSSRVCRVMSALDQGVLAGLSGGGRLAFSARITDGQPRCQAHLALGENAA